MDNGLTTFDGWILGITILLIAFGVLMGMLTVFRRLRKFAGMALMITAIMLAGTVWLLAADTVISGGGCRYSHTLDNRDFWWALSRRCQWHH